jgi:hypothetical protein
MLKWIKQLHGWCNRHEWILILLLTVIVLRLPSLCTPHFYGDEEIYFVMGRAWNEGVPLYHAMFDHKPPLIYLLAGLAPTVFSFRIALLLSMLIHTVLFWRLAQLFWGEKGRRWAYLSSATFVALTSLPTFEGLIVNAELLMMLPVTLSLLLVWKASTNDVRRFALAGVVAGIGWLYKIPVIFDVVAIALYLFVFRASSLKDSLTNLFKPALWSYLLGFAVPLALTFAYYYLKGHGSDYLATVLTVNLGYVSSSTTNSWAFNPLKSGLLMRALILSAFTLLLYLIRKRLDKRFVLASLWLAFSFFGALLSFRPYPHYLQEPIVPFALILPFIFVSERALQWAVIAVFAGVGILTQKTLTFGAYPTMSVYSNFALFLSGKISHDEYFTKFDNTKRNYGIAKYLNERLQDEDLIYVWGTDPTVYNLTHRLPTGGKYIVSFHVRDLNQYDYTMEHIRQAEPKAIVVLAGSGEFAELSSYLDQNYVESYEIEGNYVYLRMNIQ